MGAREPEIAYRRGLDDRGGLDNLLLVQLGTRTVQVTDDGRHTCLVAHGRGEVDRLLGVILGEAEILVSRLPGDQLFAATAGVEFTS
jgi:hypothetical protein